MERAFQPSFDDLSTPLFQVTFCVLDVETTGGSPAQCEITEVGAVKYRGGEPVGSFQTLVDPGVPIPPTITILTGITHAMVVDAPPIETVLPSLLEFVGDGVIVGHNVRFDLSFLNTAATRHSYGRLANQAVDTAALARRLVRPEVRNLRLQTLAAHFRSPVRPIHRALDDALATAHVFHSLLERAGSLGVTNLDDLLQLPTARGSAHFSKIGLTEHLPRKPGVYIFEDRQGTPIYVGKATNLRGRVRQYFYGDTRKTISNMLKELHEIRYHVCDSVLEAEVTELRLIHAHRPRYNRRSRPPKTSHFVKLTKEAFPRLTVVRTLKEDALAYLGPFRSRKTAEQVVNALWDAVPIRRCRSRQSSRRAPCAPAQLGLASCPCDGTLSEEDYRPVIDLILTGLSTSPHLLLDPLVAKMSRMAEQRRYEEAAWIRNRHQALARAIENRRSWQALVAGGLLELESPDARRVLVDHGRLVETQAASLQAKKGLPSPTTEVPPTVEAAEEAKLIWSWISTTPARLVDTTGPLALPSHPVVLLPAGRRSAA